MTLFEVYNLIKNIAKRQPNVHSIVNEFIDLNREDAEYSSIVIQQTSHLREDGFMGYGFYLGYVDRLNETKENEILIQSTAIQVLNNILYRLGEINNIDLRYGQYQIFTQRFTAEAAGAYVAITILVPEGECAENYVSANGSFNDDYNDDFDTEGR